MKTLDPLFDQWTRNSVITHQKLVQTFFVKFAVKVGARQRDSLVQGPINRGTEAQIARISFSFVRHLQLKHMP